MTRVALLQNTMQAAAANLGIDWSHDGPTQNHASLFISDLHLDDPSSPQFLRFDECLAVEARVVDEIYILGDLVEMWIATMMTAPSPAR